MLEVYRLHLPQGREGAQSRHLRQFALALAGIPWVAANIPPVTEQRLQELWVQFVADFSLCGRKPASWIVEPDPRSGYLFISHLVICMYIGCPMVALSVPGSTFLPDKKSLALLATRRP